LLSPLTFHQMLGVRGVIAAVTNDDIFSHHGPIGDTVGEAGG
jgi:hypothetical protein